jgi:hypothetical protein
MLYYVQVRGVLRLRLPLHEKKVSNAKLSVMNAARDLLD